MRMQSCRMNFQKFGNLLALYWIKCLPEKIPVKSKGKSR